MNEVMFPNVEIALGWLSCTIPKEVLDQFYAVVDDTPIQLEKGFRGYESSAVILGTGGRVGWSASRPEAHIDLSATALGLIGKGKIEAIFDVMKWVFSVGGHFTRLDISYDDRKGLVNIYDVEKALENGDVVTYWRKWNNVKSSEIGNRAGFEGETVYIGSKQSDAFLRVYNKALEQKVNLHWTRFELQLRDDLSTSTADKLLTAWAQNLRRFSETALGLLRGFIEFKDLKSDSNPTRRCLLEWWSKFISFVDKVRIVRIKAERTIEKTKNWLRNQVAPSLGLIHEIDGNLLWVNKIAFEGKERWRATHLAML